jgi:putative hydrolase of the HAD superfamily
MSYSHLKTVVFDVVGTLMEPVPSVAVAYQQAAEKQGHIIPVESIRKRFQLAFHQDDQTTGFSTDEKREYLRWRDIVSSCLPELTQTQANQAFEDLWNHFARTEHWQLFPETPQVLRSLKEQGYQLFLGSNFDSRLRSVWSGFSELVSQDIPLIISSEVGFRKPSPEFYRAVCQKAGMPSQEILFVGDDLVNDVEAPHQQGFLTLLVDRRSRFCHERGIESLEGILPWISNRKSLASN